MWKKSHLFCRQQNSHCHVMEKRMLLCHLHKEDQTLGRLQQLMGKLVTDQCHRRNPTTAVCRNKIDTRNKNVGFTLLSVILQRNSFHTRLLCLLMTGLEHEPLTVSFCACVCFDWGFIEILLYTLWQKQICTDHEKHCVGA